MKKIQTIALNYQSNKHQTYFTDLQMHVSTGRSPHQAKANATTQSLLIKCTSQCQPEKPFNCFPPACLELFHSFHCFYSYKGDSRGFNRSQRPPELQQLFINVPPVTLVGSPHTPLRKPLTTQPLRH